MLFRRTQIITLPASRLDNEVLRALVKAAIPTDAPPPRSFRLGICNEDGAVYRVVELYSLAERTKFTSLMEALAFREETGLGGARRNGYDATFSLRR
jgi:hypothetical protein